MKIRSTLPSFTRSLNDSCRFIQFPSRGAGITASFGLSWAEDSDETRHVNSAASNTKRQEAVMRKTPVAGGGDAVSKRHDNVQIGEVNRPSRAWALQEVMQR